MPGTIWVQTLMPERLQHLGLQVLEYNELSRRCLFINPQFVDQKIIYFSASQIQMLYSAMYKQTDPCLCYIQ